MKKRIELYDAKRIARLKAAKTVGIVLLVLIAGGALAACIVMLTKANSRNMLELWLRMGIVSGAAGCVSIYLLLYVVLRSGREAAHAERISAEEKERMEGVIEVGEKCISIPKSISVRKVTLTTEGEDGQEKRLLNVRAGGAKALEKIKGKAEVYAAHGYIAAVEYDEDP